MRLGMPRFVPDLFLTAALASVLAAAGRWVGGDGRRVIVLVMPLLAAPQAVRGAGLFAAESADGTLAEWLALPEGIDGVFVAEFVAEGVRLGLRVLALVIGLLLGHLSWGPSQCALVALASALALAAHAASASARLRGVEWLMSAAAGLVLIAVVSAADRIAVSAAPVAIVHSGLAIGLMALAAACWSSMRSELRSDRWRLRALRT